MKKIPLSEVQDGMILAKPVIGSDGKILLAEGEVLKAKMAMRLSNWGVAIAYIREEGEEGSSDEDGEQKAARLKMLENTFKGVLDNPNMKTIYVAIKKHIQEKEA
ncbi:hypothetical protein ACFL5V_02345 [Fibrobacterota bacterium]